MLLIISLLLGFCLSLEGREPPLCMWAWRQLHLESAEALSELLDFCIREEITQIYQHVSIKKGMLRQNRIHAKECPFGLFCVF